MCVTLNSRTLRSLVSSPYGRVCARFEEDLIARTLPEFHTSPRDRVCARFEPVVSNSCSTSGSCEEVWNSGSWVFKAGEEVCGERYWLIFMGTVGDGDFWLFDWRIAQEMCELKCVHGVDGMLWGDIYGLYSELIF